MATWPSGNKPATTTTDADSKSISGARVDINKALTNQNAIIDTFNIGTPGSGDDNKVLTYDHGTGFIILEASAGGSQSPLTAELDQDGFMIKDTSRNYQILGNTASPSSGDFDSFSGGGARVHGVVNVNKVSSPTNRVHSNPRLSMVTAGSDAAASGSTANRGRLRQNYVEGIYDMAGFDNLTNGFGRGQNGMFVSGLVTNSTTTTSNLTEQTALTITPQIDTVDANSIIITDQAGVEVQAYCNGTGSSSTNFYGFFYNAPAGDESARIGLTNHYSFYGADANATLLNLGPLVAKGLSYPTSDGSAGQVIKTDGSGNLTFATAGSGGSPSNGYHDGGTIGTSGNIAPNYNNGVVQRFNLTAVSPLAGPTLVAPTGMSDGDEIILIFEVGAGTDGEEAKVTIGTGVGYYSESGSYADSKGEAFILRLTKAGSRFYVYSESQNLQART